jgi:hypothetical protein
MLSRFSRLINTIRYISCIQIFFQIWYRVKKRFVRISHYKRYESSNLNSNFKCDVINILKIKNKEYYLNNEFCFLNVHHSFGDKIDWNYCDQGKLWNYNLQYFNFLHDDSVTASERFELLKSFSQDFLNNLVPPEPYPVSLRIINSLLFHLRFPIKDDKVKRALMLQISYLDNNLEFHILANHLLENAFALFIASLFIEDKRLNKKATKLLLNQLDVQILSDGGHFECSPMYQSILLSRLLLAIELSTQSDLCNNSTINKLRMKAQNMLSWMKAYSFPDGSWALMNDAAINIAPTTNQLFSAAKSLNINFENHLLRESGFRKLVGNNWEAIVKVGPIQPSYQPGHSHADINSFCLWYDGKQIVVDPGTSTYSISMQRDKERSTSSHNTVSFFGMNQSDVWGGFRVGKRARVDLINDDSQNLTTTVYFLGNNQISHTRSFIVSDNQLDIIDESKTQNSKFNLKPVGNILLGKEVSVGQETTFLRLNNNVLVCSDGKISIEESEYASSFNNLQKSKKLVYPISRKHKVSFKFI